jgi:hypothetical protein
VLSPGLLGDTRRGSVGEAVGPLAGVAAEEGVVEAVELVRVRFKALSSSSLLVVLVLLLPLLPGFLKRP